MDNPALAPGQVGFVQAGGRRYLADNPYPLPKDDGEINRLDFQHFMLRYAMRGNYAAPLRNPRSILDVGCGTGRWAMEMARLFPQANVIGTDVVAPPLDSQETPGQGIDRRPENYVFVQGNVFDGLPFADSSFDLVHQRLLYSAIPIAKWPDVVRELARLTRPDGWVELLEAGLPPAGGPAMNAMQRWTVEGGKSVGLDMQAGARIDQFLRDANLVNVQIHRVDVPLGRHQGRLGTMMETNLLAILRAGRGLSVARGIASAEEYDWALSQWPAEVAAHQASFPFYVALGQRII